MPTVFTVRAAEQALCVGALRFCHFCLRNMRLFKMSGLRTFICVSESGKHIAKTTQRRQYLRQIFSVL